MDKTLWKYLIKLQVKMLFNLSLFIFAFIFLFTFVDNMRRVPENCLYPILTGATLAICKSPIVFCDLFTYLYFISAVTVLWRLANSHEITVLKSIGKSPKQILHPFLGVGTIIGLFFIFAIHPACMYLSKNMNYIEHKLIDATESSEKDIWISKKDGNKEIIHISSFKDEINYISIFTNKESIFAHKLDIKDNSWKLYNGYINTQKGSYIFDEKILPSLMTIDDIKRFSVSCTKCSIYNLFSCLFDNGFSVTNLGIYIIQLNKILSNGLMLFIFAMIAALMCLPLSRYRTKTSISSGVIFVSIGSRVIIDLCENVGNTGAISPIFCIWAPVLAILFISSSLLIWKEA